MYSVINNNANTETKRNYEKSKNAVLSLAYVAGNQKVYTVIPCPGKIQYLTLTFTEFHF